MYIPASFRVDDTPALHAFMNRFSFATLITANDDPMVTHLPLVLLADRGKFGTLIGHVARPNNHWQLDHANCKSVAIFHGPHAYVSPRWYRETVPAVPTWNYAVVHATGRLKIIEDASRTSEIVEQISRVYEPDALPRHNQPPAEVHDRLLRGIVAFEMPIDDLVGKFKLGQNRSQADQAGMIAGLEAAGDPDSLALAALCRSCIRPTSD